MSTTPTPKSVAGRIARIVAAAALLLAVAVPATTVYAVDPTAVPTATTTQPASGDNTEVGAANTSKCDVKASTPDGVNFVVMDQASCDALGKYAGGYATIMTYFMMIVGFWFIVVVLRLGWQVIKRGWSKDPIADDDDNLTQSFFKQIGISVAIAVISYMLVSRGINVLLGMGNGAFGMLDISSKDSPLIKYGGAIGGLLFTLQKIGSMGLLLIGVPIGAWRFIKLYSSVNLSSRGDDTSNFTAASKGVALYFVMLLIAWLMVRYGPNLLVDLYKGAGDVMDKSTALVAPLIGRLM